MARRYGLSLLFLFLCLVLCASVSWAQWIRDGVPVCIEEMHQYGAKIVPDGANGAIVVWEDQRSGSGQDIYGNRIDENGYVLGPPEGVQVCVAADNQFGCEIILDGVGGVIVMWSDERYGGHSIYAQRVDTLGVALWATDGINICAAAVNPNSYSIVSDGSGGAIIVWIDYRNGNNDVYAQRIDMDGNPLWDPDGVGACVYSGDKYSPSLVSDGSGGAVIAWSDYRNGDSDIYAQHIDAEGNLLWETDGIPVCTADDNQANPRLVAVSGGGAYIVWFDYRSGYHSDVYAQRIDQDGLAVWEIDGIAVCMQDWGRYGYRITEDGDGGLIVAWYDDRSGEITEVYAQRIDPDGNLAWGQCGIRVFPVSGESDIAVMADGEGGVIVAMDAYYDESWWSDIYAQRIDHDGNLLWGPRGMAVSTAPDYQAVPVLVPDGCGGAIIAWEDYRVDGNDGDIYCQRIGSSGLWGSPEPEIVSCLDVPGDQGGWVRITTRASSHDAAGEYDTPIAGYNVWRMIGEGGGGGFAASAGAVQGSAAERSRLFDLLTDPSTAASVRVDAAGAALLGLPEGEWESVGFWFATRDTLYNITVPTKNDSTEEGIPFEIFIVTAHAASAGVFVVSEPATGYSVDNLSPGLTAGFAGNEIASPHGLELLWTANSAPDLWKYEVYRGDDSLFVPGGSNLLGTTQETTLFDPTWAIELQYYYKLVAVDRHGNESPAALLRPDDVNTGTLLQSFAASLAGPGVEIAWTLSEAVPDVSFSVLRAEVPSGSFEELASAVIMRDGLSFSLRDRSCEPGTAYRYRVDVVDEAGRRVLFETDVISIPAMPLTLYQNHPNPFNPSTVISYYLPAAGAVTLYVYDSAGRLITRLIDGERRPQGTHSIEWRGVDSGGRPMGSGIYFYRLTSGKETVSRKMVLLR